MFRLMFLFTLLVSINSFALSEKDLEEVRHASEAAPSHITQHATFTVFEEGEFRLIQKGTNSFTCFVIREPKGRYEPACLNEEAMVSVFPVYKILMTSLYNGHSYKNTYKKIAKAFNAGKLPAAETGALVYMMSPNNLVYNPVKDELLKMPIHHMYFYPKLRDETFSLPPGRVSLWQGFPHLSALVVIVGGE